MKKEELHYSQESIKSAFEKMWNRNSNGDIEIAKHKFYNIVTTENLDPEMIANKYVLYVDALSPYQDTKYTKKDKEIKNVSEYIGNRMWKQNFKPIIKRNIETERYLLGKYASE